MEHKYININGLFGICDCKIELSRKCNILIGPNGSGKSSILKIINYLSEGDFIKLSSIYFNSLEWLAYKNDRTNRLEYKDIFPDKDIILNDIDVIMDKKYEPYLTSKNNNSNLPIYQSKEARELISKLERNELLYTFLSGCYFDKQQPQNIEAILLEYDGYDGFIINDYKQMIKDILCRYVNEGHIKYFKKSNLERKLIEADIEYSLFPQKVIYIDLVEKYELNNKSTTTSLVGSATLDWLGQTHKKSLETPSEFKKSLIHELSKYKDDEIAVSLRHLYENIDNFNYDGLIDNPPVINTIEKLINTKGAFMTSDDIFIDRLFKEKIIDINRLVSRYYYKEEFVNEFNRRALQISKDLLFRKNSLTHTEIIGFFKYFKQKKESIDSNIPFEEELSYNQKQLLIDMDYYEKFINDKDALINIDHYIIPILARNILINFSSKEIAFYSEAGLRPDLKPILRLANFYYQEIDKLKDLNNRSEKIKSFEELLNKYIDDKDIIIYPSGIQFKKKYSKLDDNSFKYSVYESRENTIDLSYLSSGEKKIILLLSLAILVNDRTIILDEPELSLSFIWQEQLLPDLLKSSGNIYTATHSPYIVSDDILANFIVYLPMESNS